MPTLTLLSVAAPETQDVAGFLSHLEGLPNEHIVIDCGLPQSMRTLLEEGGATLLKASDFTDESHHLNLAIKKAASDWILRVDLDERLSPELRRALPTVVKNDAAGAGVFGIAYADAPTQTAAVWEMRLFRRAQAFYRYPVQADITPAVLGALDQSGQTQHFLTGTLQQLDPPPLAETEARLRKMAETSEFRLYAHYRLLRLAELYQDEELLEEASEQGEQVLDAAPPEVLQNLSFAGAFLSALAKYIFVDDTAACLGWLDSWAARVPSHAELSFTRGLLCEQLGYTARARTEYTRCLSRGNPGLNAQYAMIRPTVALARLDLGEGRAEAALTSLDTILSFAPRDQEALLSLASIARQLGGNALSQELAQAYRDSYGECLERHVAWGEAALWSGDHDEAVLELTEASMLAPEGEHTELLKKALSGSSPQSAGAASS